MHLPHAAAAGLALAVASIPALAASDQQQQQQQQLQSSFRQGQLGFSLGAVLPGSNGGAVSKTTQDYMEDLQAIKANTDARIVRMYAASQNDQAANVLPAAKQLGFQVLLGVWVNNATDPLIDEDTAAIAAVAEKYQDVIYGVTVGSEGLYRGNYTSGDLVGIIKKFKSTPGIENIQRIGTADTWNALTDGRGDAIIQSPDVNLILSNAFSWWQNGGTPQNNASYCFHDDIQQSLTHIQQLRGSLDDIDYWVGETGWPTDGGNYGTPNTDHYSVASVDNAQQFFSDGVCAALAFGVNTFVFEAFDEPLKPNATGLNGQSLQETHWGVMDIDRKPKYKLDCSS